jgi:ATP/maltotriose-dependent transcriptional regulator MalT
MIEHGPSLIVCGRRDPITEALAVLPADILERRPELTGVSGLFRRLIGDSAAAVALAARAGELATTMSTGTVTDALARDAVYADAMILQLWKTHFGWQDLPSTIANTRIALGCIPSPLHDHRPTLVLSPERQSWLSLELAAAEMWAGDLAEASVHADLGLVGARATNNAGLLAAAHSHRALLELIGGNARLAADSAYECLEHTEQLGSGTIFEQRAYLVLGWVSYIKLEFSAASHWLGQMSAQTRGHSSVQVTQMLHSLLQSALLCESGDAEQAQRTLSDPVGTHTSLPGFLERSLAQFRWNAATAAGDRSTAHAQLKVLQVHGFTAEADCLTAVELIMDGDYDAALAGAERALSVDGQTDVSTRSTAAVVRTAALLLTGSREQARLSLLDALTRTAPQELLYLLTAGLIAGPGFLDLLADESHRVGAHPYAATALGALGKYQSQRDSLVAVGSPTEPIDEAVTKARGARPTSPQRPSAEVSVNGVRLTLTQRELDVLEQLALGSSYFEIGLALYITENTVKTHLASLYRKLGVERRSAALRAARELGLL